MDIQDIVSQETARQDIYESLAYCYHMPDEETPSKLENLSKQLSNIDSSALSHINLMKTEIENSFYLESLKLEFTRLFIGPYSLPAPPYGSIYIEKERKVMGDSTMDVQKRYRSFGLDISGSFKEVPDHISAELEFMFFLIFKEIESFQSDMSEQAQELLSHQNSFITDHLKIWVPDFTDCVIEHTKTEFYCNLAKATKVFILEEIEYLKHVSILAPQN